MRKVRFVMNRENVLHTLLAVLPGFLWLAHFTWEQSSAYVALGLGLVASTVVVLGLRGQILASVGRFPPLGILLMLFGFYGAIYPPVAPGIWPPPVQILGSVLWLALVLLIIFWAMQGGPHLATFMLFPIATLAMQLGVLESVETRYAPIGWLVLTLYIIGCVGFVHAERRWVKVAWLVMPTLLINTTFWCTTDRQWVTPEEPVESLIVVPIVISISLLVLFSPLLLYQLRHLVLERR